jgi:hypothetical protein
VVVCGQGDVVDGKVPVVATGVLGVTEVVLGVTEVVRVVVGGVVVVGRVVVDKVVIGCGSIVAPVDAGVEAVTGGGGWKCCSTAEDGARGETLVGASLGVVVVSL